MICVCLFVSTLLVATNGCIGNDNESHLSKHDKPFVITTISPITSIVENIGGTRIILEGVVPEAINAHTFEPPPSIAARVSDADLIVLNGLFLEESFLEIAKVSKQPQSVILPLGDLSIDTEEWEYDLTFPKAEGRPNPHLWTNPIIALKYADLVRNELTALDPENIDYYEANYQQFRERILELDSKIKAAFSTVPEKNRKLLTYHDSFPYFGEQYGMEIIGAIQPSDYSNPSAREIAYLIDLLRELKLPAIFGSYLFPTEVVQRVASEGNAKLVMGLSDDDLPGNAGDPNHTYFGLMANNVILMVEGLGGDAKSLSTFDTTMVFSGNATTLYP